MKKMALILLIITTFIPVLVGCASRPPSHQELANADYGPYPENWQNLIKARLKLGLVDPESAQYRFPYGQPFKGWKSVQGDRGEFSSKTIYGWHTCFEYNAKNRMGGYTGYKQTYVMINKGRIQAFWNDELTPYVCRDILSQRGAVR